MSHPLHYQHHPPRKHRLYVFYTELHTQRQRTIFNFINSLHHHLYLIKKMHKTVWTFLERATHHHTVCLHPCPWYQRRHLSLFVIYWSIMYTICQWAYSTMPNYYYMTIFLIVISNMTLAGYYGGIRETRSVEESREVSHISALLLKTFPHY